ncbi:hypothetical protein [Bacillus velezensis]|uniref:hypothetical protein n=1 Tax=Bacillus velezensis TaxID=492670 RepID=UPI000FFC9ED9|nr:hypothetical protein [Bacillus velezensis]MEE4534482.1 hypothetical protein [Bacillus velezensis]QWF28004.1 hypothetical protein KM132_12880 [Bacillus velezensis]THC38653.1 hypothetical protein D0872_02340 [Bacillus velezensis]
MKLATNVSNLRKEIEKLNLSQVADLRLYAKDKYERAANFSTKASIITITIVPVFLFLNSYFNSYFNYGLGLLSEKYNISDLKPLENSNELQKDFDNISEHIIDTYVYIALGILLCVFIALFIRRINVSNTNKNFNLIDEIYEKKLKREEKFQEDYKQLRKMRAMNWRIISCVHFSDRLEVLMKCPNRIEAEFFMFYELDHIKEVEVILGISEEL